MAVAAQKSWLLQIHVLFRKLACAVSNIPGTGLPHTAVQAHISRLQALQCQLENIARLAMRTQIARYGSPQSGHAPLLMDFVQLVQALIPQLTQFGSGLNAAEACSVGTPAEELFWELWRTLAVSFYGLKAVQLTMPHIWSEQDMPMFTSLYSAFHTLLVWLETIWSSPVWRSMKHGDGTLERDNELRLILEQPITFFLDFSSQSGAIINSHMQVLNPRSIPLICSMISETIRMYPARPKSPAQADLRTTRYDRGCSPPYFTVPVCSRFLPLLSNLLSNLTLADRKTGHNWAAVILTDPDVLQLLAFVLILPSMFAISGTHEAVKFSLSALTAILNLPQMQRNSHQQDALSESVAQTHVEYTGLFPYGTPLQSSQALVMDMRLLNALSMLMNRDITLMLDSYRLQHLVVEYWNLLGKPHSLPAATLSQMYASLVRLAKQCSHHGLQLLQLAQREAQPRPTQRAGVRVRVNQKLQPLPQRDAARLRDMKRFFWNEGGMEVIHAVMLGISEFQANALTEGDNATTGKCVGPLVECCLMPGWASVWEAFVRAQFRDSAAFQITDVADLAGRSLVLLGQALDTQTLQACLGFTLTVCKLLRQLPYKIDQETAQQTLWARQPVNMSAGNLQRETNGERAFSWVPNYVSAVYLLSEIFSQHDSGGRKASSTGTGVSITEEVMGMTSGGGGGGGSSGSGSSSSGRSSSTVGKNSSSAGINQTVSSQVIRVGLNPHLQQANVPSDPQAPKDCQITLTGISQGNSDGGGKVGLREESKLFLIHQLLVCTCLTLLKVVCSTSEREMHSHGKEVLASILPTCEQMSCTELRDLVVLLLKDASSPTAAAISQSEAGAMWERYAVKHLHGRLTLGCCHLGCTNLSGVSEAALPTQLCGGCRQARYCSVACQKAAWIQGGHCTVCGK